MRWQDARPVFGAVLAAVTLLPGCAASPQGRPLQSENSAAAQQSESHPDSSSTTTTTQTEAAFTLASQPTSEFPVGQEWRELVPLNAEMFEMFKLGYTEWQRRIAGCMAARGFTYVPPTFVDEMRTQLNRSMNPLNRAAAANFGYHLPPQPTVVDPNTDSSAQFQEALGGSDTDGSTGCGQIAFKVAYDEVNRVVNDYQVLVDDLDKRVNAYFTSREGAAAQGRWADCMRSAGFPFASRDEIMQKFLANSTVTGEEIQVRQADITCDVATRFTEDRSAWERATVVKWQAATETQWPELAKRVSATTIKLQHLASEPV